MKKISIIKHGGGELANQLWNYISIYAYGLEKGLDVTNPSFYEYHSHFNLLPKENLAIRLLSRAFSNYEKRKQAFFKKSFRKLYSLYPFLINIFLPNRVASSINTVNKVSYLPPTESDKNNNLLRKKYFMGWLFRNPLGIERYRKEIISAFRPKTHIEDKVSRIADDLKEKYSNIIGVHIRQWDYKTWKGGKYFIEQSRVKQILNEYINQNRLDPLKTLFLITSDGPIDENIFADMNVYISRENAVTDMFLLSSAEAIIGSDSSFGHFASWYGNIPHIVMKNEPMDWPYYENKTDYFQNKYCTMVQF